MAADLPPFINGFSAGERSGFTTKRVRTIARHLLLHEGVHSFMYLLVGTVGHPATWKEWPNHWPRIIGKMANFQIPYFPADPEKYSNWAGSKSFKMRLAAGHRREVGRRAW